MALLTFGTNAATSLNALKWLSGISAADRAAFSESVLDDLNPAHPIWPGSFEREGVLYIPNRGYLKALPGDYVAVDPTGWPILVSANAIANGPWAHS